MISKLVFGEDAARTRTDRPETCANPTVRLTAYRSGMIGLAAVALTACSVPDTEQPSLLRNPTVPLSIISRGGAEAMEGTWFVRQASPGYRDIGLVQFDTTASDRPEIRFLTSNCTANNLCEEFIFSWAAETLAQNRWQLSAIGTDEKAQLWVVWIDDDLRTAAIGSPDSDIAFVLDRTAKGGADRITAAREVLSFNGYNIAALQPR